MNCADLLKLYDEMLCLTQKMLASARHSDWDRLIELEHERSVIVERLKQEDIESLWTLSEGVKKGELIRSMLDIDAEIKLLTESQMMELRGMLDSVRIEQKLNNTYETP
ncbi:flagellar protein FliT [Sulfuricella sp. T08]|uniref:flagellar protein FliT n=1 Tax=Sulfuricella sp. T08 TaxID=1632857 RepID=UPI000617A16D|nr:flagellar protein FliT [Sulfuricella sp. T08]GAO35715.1 flagellar protein FliT [Sulfuricella sp. T08]